MYSKRIRIFSISVFSPDQKLIIGTIHFAACNQTDSSQHDTYQMWRKEIITLHINYFPGLFFNHCYCAYWPQKVNSLNHTAAFSEFRGDANDERILKRIYLKAGALGETMNSNPASAEIGRASCRERVCQYV